jgi:hypothetical protein
MIHGQAMQLSFAGSVEETIVFHRDTSQIAKNYAAAVALVGKLGDGSEKDPARTRPGGGGHRWRGSHLWTDVPPSTITEFLTNYETHPKADKVNKQLLREFIERQQGIRELTSWTVAILSGQKEWTQPLLPDMELIERSPHPGLPEQRREGKYVIRRLLAPRDEAIDLQGEAYERALQQTIAEWHQDRGRSRRKTEPDTPNGPCIRQQRPATNGLLLIYPLCPQTAGVDGNVPVIGFGLSFPASQRARKVTYQVNRVFRLSELGGDL